MEALGLDHAEHFSFQGLAIILSGKLLGLNFIAFKSLFARFFLNHLADTFYIVSVSHWHDKTLAQGHTS